MVKPKMVIELKSVLKNQRWQLISKSLLWGLSLFFLWDLGVSLFLSLIFLGLSLFFYAQPYFNTVSFSRSVLVLSLVSLTIISYISNFLLLFLVLIFLSSLFYLTLSLKNLTIINRIFWSHFLRIGIFYLVFLVFFLSSQSSFFWIKSLLLFIVTWILFNEWLKPNNSLIAPIFSFLLLQSFWVINLLPFGFINAANLAVILTYLLGLNQKIGKKELIFASTAILIIFLTTKWRI